MLSFIISVTIETTQLIIGRVFDVDDILLNVLGGLAGYCIYKIVHTFKNKLPNFLKNEIFYNIVVTIIIGLIVFYIYNVLGAGI